MYGQSTITNHLYDKRCAQLILSVDWICEAKHAGRALTAQSNFEIILRLGVRGTLSYSGLLRDHCQGRLSCALNTQISSSPTGHSCQLACHTRTEPAVQSWGVCSVASEVQSAHLSLHGLHLTVNWFQERRIRHAALGAPLSEMLWQQVLSTDAVTFLNEPLSSPGNLASWMLRYSNFRGANMSLPISTVHQRTHHTWGSQMSSNFIRLKGRPDVKPRK